MNARNLLIKKIITQLITLLLAEALYSIDTPKVDTSVVKKNQTIIDMQEVYDNMSGLIPAVVLLQPEGTSDVNDDVLNKLYNELKDQMISSGLFKPYSMTKYLDQSYGDSKASNIYSLVNTLGSNYYSVALKGLMKANFYNVGSKYVLMVSIYPFSNKGYPITVLRTCLSAEDIPSAVGYCLTNLKTLYKNVPTAKVKVAVAPFEISCRTLVEQKTGEFDFIKTSFAYQNGVEIKEADDYFSHLFAYQTECTGLYEAVALGDLKNYSKANVTSSSIADKASYLIKGKIILTDDNLNLVTVDLINTSTSTVSKTIKYFTKNMTLDDLWKINNKIICGITDGIYTKNDYAVIENIHESDRGFYYRNMLVGWGSLEGFPVPRKKIIINTGSTLISDIEKDPSIEYSAANNDYFIYFNNDNMYVYRGRQGEYIWNLLEK